MDRLKARWRFNLFLLLVAAGAAAAIPALGWARGFILAFDGAALFFLATTLQLMYGRDTRDIRHAAARVDASRVELIAITAVLTAVILAALVVELMQGKHDPWGAGLAIATLVIAWFFSTAVYALHYAHLYYTAKDGKDAGGLDFPGDDDPDYWDFVYFAVVLGATFQVSDVAITARPIRRLATFHGLAAFLFNIGVVALTINVVGSAL